MSGQVVHAASIVAASLETGLHGVGLSEFRV